jgi:glycosyltransferase involved in cell wall biosynthesis
MTRNSSNDTKSLSVAHEQPLRVLHLITEKTWRGGENQVRFLLEHSPEEIEWHVAAPEGSMAASRLKGLSQISFLETKGFALMRSVLELNRYCTAHGIDIIDCQTSKAHSIGLCLKWLDKTRKLVVHRRVDFMPSKNRFSRKKYMSPLVDRYIAISDAIAAILCDYGISANKITTVHSAVDDSSFKDIDKAQAKAALCKELGINPAIPLISNVAYHTEQKGQETLIKALGILKTQNQPFQCLLAGSGHLTPGLKELSTQLGLSDSVHFLGIRNDVAKILAASDIFAFPSNKEGLGTSLLDASHAGCAIAASNVGGIPEIVIQGQTGLLSPVKDEVVFAENLSTLINDQDFARSLAKRAKEHVQKNFSVQTMAAGNVKVYRELLLNR